MAGQIRIDPETMRMRAKQYKAEGDSVTAVIQNMDNLLNNLQAEWEGAASQSYAQRYAELKPGFQKAEQLIFEISDALVKVAQHLETTDNDIAGSFRG